MSSIMRWRSGEMLVGSIMGNSCLSEVAKTSILKTELPAPISLSCGYRPRSSELSRSDLVVCPACSIAWGWKSPIQPDGGEGLAKHKGGRREAASEGSAEQNHVLTDRNRIRGILGRTSGPLIAKSISIKGQGCRSGGMRGRQSDLPGEVCAVVPDLELREPRGNLIAAQKSAEGILRPCGWQG